MSIEYVFRPLQWPALVPRTRASDRERNVFKADWKDTMKKLDYELGKLGARQCVIQLDLKESDFRIDGRPRDDRTPASPAAIVAFTAKDLGALQLPCDRMESWRHNVRAIAYHLEHLRLSALYGVGARGEQYRGWKALPDARLLVAAMTVEEASVALSALAGQPQRGSAAMSSRAAMADLYRAAAKAHHPDQKGDPAKWQQLQEAKRVLDAHHGGTGVGA